jgi:late competence protein required for DNA uptake (superfamily II DNA/RNA helicase)
MKRHGFNLKTPDFIWNKNRLALEKEQIKQQMMKVIEKKPAKGKKDTD